MTPARRFQFRLALALGYANPDALMAEIPDRIYREWAIYALWEPFGEERADLRAGIVAAAVANAAVITTNVLARKRRRADFKPRDFMPKFRPQAETFLPATARSAPEDRLFAKVKMLNWLFGGSFVDKREQ